MKEKNCHRPQPEDCTQKLQSVRCCGRVTTEQQVNEKVMGNGQGQGKRMRNGQGQGKQMNNGQGMRKTGGQRQCKRMA